MPVAAGRVSEMTRGKPAKERARIKAVEMAKVIRKRQGLAAAGLALRQYARDDLIVRVVSVADVGSSLVCTLEVERAGVVVPFSNPLIIENVPILRPTGEFEIVTDENGDEYRAEKLVEDLEGVFEFVIMRVGLLAAGGG